MELASSTRKQIANNIPSILLIICLVGLPQISETIYSPALPAVTEALKTTSHLVQWTLSIYFIGFAAGVGIWGKVSDHIGRRPTMLAGLIIYLAFSILCGFSTQIYWLLTARFFQAFGISVGSVITQTIMRDCFNGNERNKIFAIVGMTIAFAPALGPILGGYLTAWFSWSANFVFLGLLGSLLFIYTYFGLPETRQHQLLTSSTDNPLPLKALFIRMIKDRHILGSSLLVGGFNGILFSYYSEAPYLFIDMYGMSAEQYGMLGIFMAAGIFFGSFLSHRFSHLISSIKLIKLASLINLAAMVIFVFLVSFNGINLINFERSILLIMLIMMVFYISFGLAIPNILSKALVNYQQNIGAAGSILGLIYYIWVALIIFGIGIFSPNLYVMPVYFLAVSFVIMFSSFLLVKSSK